MDKFHIVGLGPGNLDYLLPVARKIIEKSDVLIGGRRNLKSLKEFAKEEILISVRLDEIRDYIRSNVSKKKLVLVVSGDSGFYSMLGFISKNFSKEEYEVIPGISSLQYMFSKLGLMWNEAVFTSLHGRDNNIEQILNKTNLLGILTDSTNTPQRIASILMEGSLEDIIVHVGERLSYEDESIRSFTARELIDYKESFDVLNVVVLERS